MNVRFWTYANDGFVKLTIRPGQSLNWHTGGPTDEGYHARYETYSYDGTTVTLECYADGRDCDGRYSSESTVECKRENLTATPADEFGPARPDWQDWQEVTGSRRDYAAEAAGY